jgi:hypothetical protein
MSPRERDRVRGVVAEDTCERSVIDGCLPYSTR